MALESCSLESSGRLLESVSNCRSRWMVIVSQETQDPAYRATLLFRLGFLNDQATFDSNFRAIYVRDKW